MKTKTKGTVEVLDEASPIEFEVKAKGTGVGFIRMVSPVRGKDRQVLRGALEHVNFGKFTWEYVESLSKGDAVVSVVANLVNPIAPNLTAKKSTGVKKRPVTKKIDKAIDQLWDKEGAKRIFRSKDDFEKWLGRPHVGLQGQIPLNVLKTDTEAVAALIVRLIHGVLA